MFPLLLFLKLTFCDMVLVFGLRLPYKPRYFKATTPERYGLPGKGKHFTDNQKQIGLRRLVDWIYGSVNGAQVGLSRLSEWPTPSTVGSPTIDRPPTRLPVTEPDFDTPLGLIVYVF